MTTPTVEEENAPALNIGTYKPDEKDEKTIAKWKSRFERAKRFRDPYTAKWLRMYYLYRAYRNRRNYAYQTNLMPAIGFEIIETIKPRLSAARMRTRIYPTKKEDVNNPAIESWDDLVNYNFEALQLEDKKIDWIQAMLNFGNGYAHLYWVEKAGGGDPAMDILDNWLLYFDPNAGPRLKDSAWEIKQIFKKKARIEKEEKARVGTAEGEEAEKRKLYKNLDYVEDRGISDDPRSERFNIETLKMGQIDSGRRGANDSADTQTAQSDERSKESFVELWECYDHETDEIITIANREILIRQEETPYKNVNNGRLIVDLPCIKIPWSAYSMSILEPVETTIHEIADSRNQAMDDIVFNLDPIRKIRKDSGITADDIKYAPGAVWELKKADDVVVERAPDISNQWVQKDGLLRNEIQSNLAISEYVRGIPQNSTEPMGKVELLLMQTNIRFSQFVRQLKISLTDIANILIEMNREFLTEEKSYRILGEEVSFKDFKDEDRDVEVDADIEIEVIPERTYEQTKSETLELYKIFVADDKPDPADPEAVRKWQTRKRAMQQMILEDYGKDEYIDLILGTEEKPEEKAEAAAEEAVLAETEMPASDIPSREPQVPPEALAGMVPQMEMPGQAPRPGLLARLLGRSGQ